MIVRQELAVDLVEAVFVDFEHAAAPRGRSSRSISSAACRPRRSRARGAAGGWRCAACRASGGRSPCAPSASMGMPRISARAADDDLERLDVVEVEAVDDAEARAQRRGEQAGARRGADEREARQLDLQRARGRALADDDVDRGSPPWPSRGSPRPARARRWISSMKSDVARLEVREDAPRGRPACSSAGPEVDAQAGAHLVGDDVGQRRLAQARAGRRAGRDRALARACAPPRWRSRFSLTFFWPMYSSSRCGRSDSSTPRSSASGTGERMRSSANMGAF